MRVLHVGAGNMFGGVESTLTAIARHRAAMPDAEHEFGLFFEGRVARELRATAAPVHRLAEVRTRRAWTVWRARRELAALLESRQIDVVLAHGFWCFAVTAPATRGAGRRCALFAHDKAGSGHWIERWAGMTTPDLVLANSAFTARTLERLYPSTPSEVVHCPVESRAPIAGHERTASRRRLGVDEGDVVIVIASRIEELKGHRVLIEALGELRALPGWRCWVAGGGQRAEDQRLIADLEDLARRRSVADRVSWLGQRDDVPALLAAADLYCQPNTAPESFGVVFVEALQARLPVVTSAIGGALEIIDGECGALVPPGDASAVAGTLRALVTSEERRRALGASGPARARRLCDPDAQVRRLSLALTMTGGPS